MLCANRGASMSGDCDIRRRNVTRSSASRGQVAGQSGRDRHELLGSFRRQFLEAQVAQLAPAGPADHRLAQQRQGRDPHPECVQAGGVTVVGQRIQARDRSDDRASDTPAAGVCRRSPRGPRRSLRARARPGHGPALEPGGARSTSRDRGTARSTSAQSVRHPSLTLQKLFRQPNVIAPDSSAGSALTGGLSAGGS